jgi:hypothetical protein
MEEQTQIITREGNPTEKKVSSAKESQVLGVSVRAWIALVLVFTICLLNGIGVDSTEPLRTLAIMAVQFYFTSKPPASPTAPKQTP